MKNKIYRLSDDLSIESVEPIYFDDLLAKNFYGERHRSRMKKRNFPCRALRQ